MRGFPVLSQLLVTATTIRPEVLAVVMVEEKVTVWVPVTDLRVS